MNYSHTSVLLHKSIDELHLKPGDIYVDGTLGGGGHAEEVVRRFGNSVRIVGIDQDANALAHARARLEKSKAQADFIQGNFRDLDTILDSLHIEKVHAILLDLGLSSYQLEQSGRGFSFQNDEPLVMTFAQSVSEGAPTAEVVVNEWSEQTLETIFKGFGEERYARRIAVAIVEARKIQPIKTTGELVAIIAQAVPALYRRQRIHFATRTFQAIRIAVNDELGALSEGLHNGFLRLASGGRMAVISFHSLEDRIVKNFYRTKAKEGAALLITKKPIGPTEEEFHTNRRSRSAKLRVIEKK